MAYAILRFSKHKGGASKALGAHHERTKETYASNPDIVHDRTVQNFHLITPRWSYEQEINHRIRTAGCRVRKDSVKFVDTLVAVSPEFAAQHPTEMQAYFEHAYQFLTQQIGEENIISAVVHLDEKTPHMHLVFVPLTRDKRLSAKEILGNKKAMIRWQDDFYAHMAARWPELERGKPAIETKRKHIETQWYKKATEMDKKLDALERALSDITVFNAGKKRAEAVALLKTLLPDVAFFEKQVQLYQESMQRTIVMVETDREENAILKTQLQQERNKNFDRGMQISTLQSRLKRAETILRRLPPELTIYLDKNTNVR